MSLLDVAFPYRVRKTFGAASFALVFLLIFFEVEALVLVALGVVGRRLDLFIALGDSLLFAACLLALSASAVFWWRARTWSRQRVELLNLWTTDGVLYGRRGLKTRQH